MRKVNVGINVSEENGKDYQGERYELNVPNNVSTSEVLRVLGGVFLEHMVEIEKEIRGEI